MNSRRKGKVGEREFAALLREHGFDARRGQQFAGSPESPDVVSDALGWLHIEVKRVQNLNLTDACVQAEGDASGKPWVVAHRRNQAPWLITMRADTFFKLLRGELPPVAAPLAKRTQGTKDEGTSTRPTPQGGGDGDGGAEFKNPMKPKNPRIPESETFGANADASALGCAGASVN
jgi:hypothetical protein